LAVSVPVCRSLLFGSTPLGPLAFGAEIDDVAHEKPMKTLREIGGNRITMSTTRIQARWITRFSANSAVFLSKPLS
jgi:hypothetical protein